MTRISPQRPQALHDPGQHSFPGTPALLAFHLLLSSHQPVLSKGNFHPTSPLRPSGILHFPGDKVQNFLHVTRPCLALTPLGHFSPHTLNPWMHQALWGLQSFAPAVPFARSTPLPHLYSQPASQLSHRQLHGTFSDLCTAWVRCPTSRLTPWGFCTAISMCPASPDVIHNSNSM